VWLNAVVDTHFPTLPSFSASFLQFASVAQFGFPLNHGHRNYAHTLCLANHILPLTLMIGIAALSTVLDSTC